MMISGTKTRNPLVSQARRNSGPVDIAVRREDVLAAARNHNGLTFKGFGVLSGNATSSLLLDYKAEHPRQYWQLLRVLFGGPNPMMMLVKIEMGNDRNTSTGPEPAVMRTAEEYPDVAREPGFQLASDAKRFQPNLHVSILRWCYPAWVGSDESYQRIYRWYKNTILAVYRRYGYMVDSVNPGINERPADLGWAREFAKRVHTDETGFEGAGKILDPAGNPVPAWKDPEEKRLFHQIKIIVSDEVSTGTCGANLVHTKANRNAVDIASFHYNTADDANGSYKCLAEKFDKQVWNSEAQATFSLTGDRPDNTMSPVSGEGPGRLASDGTRLCAGTGIGGINGPLEMANTIIRGFLSSRRTMFIYQPAISAFYDGSQYSSKELVALHFPWNGYINWDGALAVLRQFSSFCHAGFEDCTSGEDPVVGPYADSSPSEASSPADSSAGCPQHVWRCIPQASRCTLSDGNPPGRGAGENSARGGADSCLTFAAPDGSAFSTVIVNDSRFPRIYRIHTDLPIDHLDVWHTRAAKPGQPVDSDYLVRERSVRKGADGRFTVRIQAWSIVTVTSLSENAVRTSSFLPHPVEPVGNIPVLDTSRHHHQNWRDSNQPHVGSHSDRPSDVEADDGLLYDDDFDYANMPKVQSFSHGALHEEDYLASRGGDRGAVPRYTQDLNGAFEVVRSSHALSGTHVLRQQVGPGMQAHAWVEGEPRTLLGDVRWANYDASISVRFPKGKSGYALLGARQWGGTDSGENTAWASLKVYSSGDWILSRYGRLIDSGISQAFDTTPGAWNRMRIRVNGPSAEAFVNNQPLARFTDPRPQLIGRLQLGSSFTHVEFDNLEIRKIKGTVPACTDLIDDNHQHRWDTGTKILYYFGPWQHLLGQNMYCYKRSLSMCTAAGASLSLRIQGTGIILLGQCADGQNGDGQDGKSESNHTARLHVAVDGKRVAVAAPTWPATTIQPTLFCLDNLPAGEHVIRLTKADNRPLVLDAIGILGNRFC